MYEQEFNDLIKNLQNIKFNLDKKYNEQIQQNSILDDELNKAKLKNTTLEQSFIEKLDKINKEAARKINEKISILEAEKKEALGKLNQDWTDEYKKLNIEYEKIKAENQKFLIVNQQWSEEYKKLNIEKQQILASNQQLSDEYKKLNAEKQQLLASNQQLSNEYKKLNSEKQNLETQNKLGIAENKRLNDEINKIKSLEKSIQTKDNKNSASQRKSIDNRVLSAFNTWAARPSVTLPDNFFYVEGDINIRTKQEIKNTRDVTEWISYKGDGIQYLFPNPNLFNDRTNIGYLYEGKMDNLKPSGNRIEVLEPCEAGENGFIEFLGKFRLL
jgi:myosin heavy subunit